MRAIRDDLVKRPVNQQATKLKVHLVGGATDRYNNWDFDFPFNDPDFGINLVKTRQFGIMATTDQYVCIFGNASYTTDMEVTNGVQTKVDYTTTDFEPIYINEPEGHGTGYSLPAETLSYMALFISLTSMVSGNVTLGTAPPYLTLPRNSTVDMQIYDSSSRSLLTWLSVCDDFKNN